MQRTLNAEEELKNANQPNIRLFHVEKISSMYALDDVTAKTWVACTPESVSEFSAVAYFFARQIQDDQKVPIGLMEADWGGTPAEAWTSMKAISADASLMPVFQTWAQMTDDEAHNKLARVEEDQERAAAKAEGKPEPKFPWHPELPSYSPGGLYNAMISPLTQFPIRGAIWYQGEANASSASSSTDIVPGATFFTRALVIHLMCFSRISLSSRPLVSPTPSRPRWPI